MPAPLANISTAASLITAVRSLIELSRMIRNKRGDPFDVEARRVLSLLSTAYRDQAINSGQYDRWYEKVIMARAVKDSMLAPLATDVVSPRCSGSSGNSARPSAISVQTVGHYRETDSRQARLMIATLLVHQSISISNYEALSS